MRFHFHITAGRIATATALVAAIAAGGLGPATAGGAEIHLRNDCRSDGGLVLLSDVAEIYSTNPDEVKALGKIDLVPAPPKGRNAICDCAKSRTCWCSVA